MASEVIMPALGMAQDTGRLLTWLKKPGEPVSVGDVLFEVETDKSVSEVEAQSDGFLTDVTVSEGEDVPVGQRIAMISDTAEDSAGPADATPKPAASQSAEPASAEPKPAPPAPTPAQKPEAPAVGSAGRVLASPKARRLAIERGQDLAQLAAAGHPQPFRAADVESLAAMNASAPRMAATSTARASLSDAAYQDFLDMLEAEDAGVPGTVIAAFAAGALRAAGAFGTVAVRVVTPRQGRATYVDPDRSRVSEIEPGAEDTNPDLIVFDLTQSRITHVDLSATSAPAVSVAREGDRVVLAIAATPSQLDDEALLICLDELAGRFDDPLRHLL